MEWSPQIPSAFNVVKERITETALPLFKSKRRPKRKIPDVYS